MSPVRGRRAMIGWTVGVVLMATLIMIAHFSVGWDALLSPWKEIPPGSLLLAWTLVVGSYGIRTIRIHQYFQPATSEGFLRSFRLVLVHNLFNNLLPMRSGEASFPILMSREFRVPFSRSIPGLVYLRVLDLHFVLLLGVLVFAWQRGPIAFLAPLALAPVPFGIFRAQGWLQDKLKDRAGKIGEISREVLLGLPANSALFWRTWFWTALNWSVKLLVFAWILRTFVPMPFSFALLGATTGELSSVLPFHGIAGAGTYEAGVLASLVPLGVELEHALRAAVNLHLFLLGASILAGALALFIPLGARLENDDTHSSP